MAWRLMEIVFYGGDGGGIVQKISSFGVAVERGEGGGGLMVALIGNGDDRGNLL